MGKPEKYRETPIKLPDDSTVMVAALAKPNYCGQNPLETFAYLAQQNVSIIYGLEAHPSFIDMALQYGLNYIDCSIPDFTAPSIELYDEVYDVMLNQASLGKKIAIHCHGGMGRTGTVLTALKLKEMAMSESFYEQTKFQNLQKALNALRKLPGNAYIVEVQEQEQGLCDYIDQLFHNKQQRHKP